MLGHTPAPHPNSNDAAAQHLCDLLLQVAGRDTNRLAGVRRHLRVLDAALPHMSAAQAHVARERIDRLQTKWGPVLPGDHGASLYTAENCEISPELRVANWLSTRRHPERLLKIIHRAACCIWSGETCLRNVMDYAYAREIDHLMCMVGDDSFKEWMIQLRIAVWEGKGVYRPGNLCRWWVENMKPTTAKDSSYAGCMRLLVSMKSHCAQ